MSGRSFLSALQLADSFFPSGAYALSHGLETAVEEGWVRDIADVDAWLRAQLVGQVGPTDGVVLGATWEAARAADVRLLAEIDRWLDCTRLVREPREASIRIGRRLLKTAEALVAAPDDQTFRHYREAVREGRAPGHQPVALGVVSQAMGVDQLSAVTAVLYSFATGVLGAALRLLRTDHEEIQAVLRGLHPVLDATARDSLTHSWREIWSAAPEIEICAMRHERATRRSFMT